MLSRSLRRRRFCGTEDLRLWIPAQDARNDCYPTLTSKESMIRNCAPQISPSPSILLALTLLAPPHR